VKKSRLGKIDLKYEIWTEFFLKKFIFLSKTNLLDQKSGDVKSIRMQNDPTLSQN